MSIKPIIVFPNPILRKISCSVINIDNNILNLIEDMLETLYDNMGVGIAAVQIGFPIRLFVANTNAERNNCPLICINPKIISFSNELNVSEEGCLSIPNYYAEVSRPKKIKINFFDKKNNFQELEADGILAKCIQHEIDHLNGILFIDHISRLKRNIIIRKFKKKQNLKNYRTIK